MAFPNCDQLKKQLDKYRCFRTEENFQAIDAGVIKDLLASSMTGILSDFQSLLSRVIDLGDKEKNTDIVDFAIHVTACLACSQGNITMLRYLLEFKKSVITAVDHRACPFLFAAAGDRPEIWTLLIDQVGYGDHLVKPGELSLSYASSEASTLILNEKPRAHEILQLLIDRGFRPEFLHMEIAAKRGSAQCLLVVLSNILSRFPAGKFHNQYILQQTVMRGKLENAKILIEKGVVDVNGVPTWQQAPEWYGDLAGPAPALQWAIDRLDMIRMLMEHGARVNVPNGEGITPLEWARKYKQPEAEKLMLELAPPEDIPEAY